jgi:hypothetical protein
MHGQRTIRGSEAKNDQIMGSEAKNDQILGPRGTFIRNLGFLPNIPELSRISCKLGVNHSKFGGFLPNIPELSRISCKLWVNHSNYGVKFT